MDFFTRDILFVFCCCCCFLFAPLAWLERTTFERIYIRVVSWAKMWWWWWAIKMMNIGMWVLCKCMRCACLCPNSNEYTFITLPRTYLGSLWNSARSIVKWARVRPGRASSVFCTFPLFDCKKPEFKRFGVCSNVCVCASVFLCFYFYCTFYTE